jgi:hypothetical protein
VPDRSMPEVPDLNTQYRAEHTLRDLTWGQGRTMPEVPQTAQPHYQDMSLDRARAQRDRMHHRMLYQQAPAQPDVRVPFQPPQMPAQNSQPQHRADSDLAGMVFAAVVMAQGSGAFRACPVLSG